MAFSLQAAGAGASEGLDAFLQRLLVQQQVDQQGKAQAESGRHNVAEEALTGRNLDQNESLRQSLEGERAQIIADRQRLGEQEKTRQEQEEALLNSPDTDPILKKFLGLRRVVPKGENIPIEVLGLQKAGTADPLEHVDVGGKDILTPRSQSAGKTGFHAPPQPGFQLVPTNQGYQRVSRSGPQGLVTTGPDNKPVMPQDPAQVRTRVATSQKVEKIIPDLSHEEDVINGLGLMGPIGGRWREFSLGTWGSPQELGAAIGRPLTDEEAQTISEFQADLGFLKSGTAMVHGGARGGGSAQIMARMDQLINANKMDHNSFKGALRAFEKLLGKYSSFSDDDGPVQDKGASTSDPLNLGIK